MATQIMDVHLTANPSGFSEEGGREGISHLWEGVSKECGTLGWVTR